MIYYTLLQNENSHGFSFFYLRNNKSVIMILLIPSIYKLLRNFLAQIPYSAEFCLFLYMLVRIECVNYL